MKKVIAKLKSVSPYSQSRHYSVDKLDRMIDLLIENDDSRNRLLSDIELKRDREWDTPPTWEEFYK